MSRISVCSREADTLVIPEINLETSSPSHNQTRQQPLRLSAKNTTVKISCKFYFLVVR